MLTVQGLWTILLVGVLGGLVAELIRIGSALRSGTRPDLADVGGSVIYVALGALVIFYVPLDVPQNGLEVLIAGAAVPAVFPAALKLATGQQKVAAPAIAPPAPAPESSAEHSWLDYMSSNF